MKFREVLSRITGLSTPVFGAQWNPPEPECAAARRVVAFLEDRRVLYVPSEVEVPNQCVQSVLKIRDALSSEIGKLDGDSELGLGLRAMRASCRKFLSVVASDERRIIQFGADRSHYASWVFISALGELRGVFGVHVAKIAAAHGLDVEDDLAAILPGSESDG